MYNCAPVAPSHPYESQIEKSMVSLLASIIKDSMKHKLDTLPNVYAATSNVSYCKQSRTGGGEGPGMKLGLMLHLS